MPAARDPRRWRLSGRLLRAFVWWRTGDRLKATERASQAGRVFGWLLVVFGLFTFLADGAFGGLWLALIGWFLVAAASAEGQRAQLRLALGGVPVRQVMSPEPETVPGSMTVGEFLEGELRRQRRTAFPVTGDCGAARGLVTLQQVRQVPQAERGRTTLDSVASPLDRVATAAPGEPVADLPPRLNGPAAEPALVIVLEDGRAVGLVSASDISRALAWSTVSAPTRHDGAGRVA